MNCIRKYTLPILMLLMLLLLVSCVDSGQARDTIDDFFAAVKAEDFEAAGKLMHPERTRDLTPFFAEMERDKQVDFQDGIEIVRYTHIQSSAYDSTVGGSLYVTTAQIAIGEQSGLVTVEIVDNKAGYGIYNITFKIGEDDRSKQAPTVGRLPAPSL